MFMRPVCIVLVLLAGFGAQAQTANPAAPPAANARFATPAVDAGDYIYVSGQGPRRPDGSLPSTFSDQVQQALENVNSALRTVGVTKNNVVYTQVYLEDISKYGEMDHVFGKYFAEPRPARAVLGVAKVPESIIQISAVAVRNISERGAVHPANYKVDDSASPGILTRDRLFVSGMLGTDEGGSVPADPAAQVDLALDRMKAVLESAGLSLAHMVFVNPYLTSDIPTRTMNEHYAKRFEFGNTPARATIQVSSLPGGSHIEYTGVAVRDLKQRRAIRPKNMPPSPTASPCVFAGDTLYCSAKSGFIPGAHGGVYADTTAHQLRQTMRNQLDNLEEAEMNFGQVVATGVYLDDLRDAEAFDEVYAQYFSTPLPARTLVQQIAPAERKADKADHYPDLEQMSLIAVKKNSRQ
jgi:enamine deaminase RidA (YjgF/YER057c/UK114 family)